MSIYSQSCYLLKAILVWLTQVCTDKITARGWHKRQTLSSMSSPTSSWNSVLSSTVSWFYATYAPESAKAIWSKQAAGKSKLNPAYRSPVYPGMLILTAAINVIVTHEFWHYRVSFWKHSSLDIPIKISSIFFDILVCKCEHLDH